MTRELFSLPGLMKWPTDMMGWALTAPSKNMALQSHGCFNELLTRRLEEDIEKQECDRAERDRNRKRE